MWEETTRKVGYKRRFYKNKKSGLTENLSHIPASCTAPSLVPFSLRRTSLPTTCILEHILLYWYILPIQDYRMRPSTDQLPKYSVLSYWRPSSLCVQKEPVSNKISRLLHRVRLGANQPPLCQQRTNKDSELLWVRKSDRKSLRMKSSCLPVRFQAPTAISNFKYERVHLSELICGCGKYLDSYLKLEG